MRPISPSSVSPRRVLCLALLTQALLVIIAIAAQRILHLSVTWGDAARQVPFGVGAALLLALLNYGVLHWAPPGWLVDGVREVYHGTLMPLFGRFTPLGILVVSAAAGVAEEWVFRGILQPWLGLAAASVTFGLAHIGGRRMLAFAAWATLMGAALGVLAMTTGGVLAPAVAHGVYDAMALGYMRRSAATPVRAAYGE